MEREPLSIRARQLTLRVALIFAGSILVAVVGQWFIQVATDKGWYRLAGKRWDTVMSSAFHALTSSIATHLAMFMAGLAVALLLDLKLFKPFPSKVGGGRFPEGMLVGNIGLKGAAAKRSKARVWHATIVLHHYENKAFLLPQAFDGESEVAHVLFENCLFHGPAVVLAGQCAYEHTSFLSSESPEEGIIEVSEARMLHYLNGVIVFRECRFRNCDFFNVGWIKTPSDAEQMRGALKEIT